MACSNCNDNSPFVVYSQQLTYNTGCMAPECAGVLTNSKCVYYAGPNLSCSGASTNDSLELILQKMDTAICSAVGDYSTYNTYCLAPILTQKQFVESISNYSCTTRTSLNTFTGTTFPAYQTSVNTRFVALEVPGITCSTASVTSTDTLQAVLNKYCTKFGVINTALSLSGVTWNNCFTVVSTPTTIAQGFSLLADQICQVKNNSIQSLPTFNNTGSCLPSPGAADSLVDTIAKIKTRLCQTGVYDATAITWGCTSSQSDLQTTIQTLVTSSNDYKQNKLTFSSDFVVTQTNSGDPCQGKTVALATPISGNDRLVATSSTDTTPGTLIVKLSGGAGIGIAEIGSNPTKQIQIANTGLTNIANSTSISLSGNGYGSALTAVARISASAGNTISILSDGLYAASVGTGINGLTTSGSNIGLGGTLLNNTTLAGNYTVAIQDGSLGVGVAVGSIGNNKVAINNTSNTIVSGIACLSAGSSYSINGTTNIGAIDFYGAFSAMSLSLSDSSLISGANSYNAAAHLSLLQISGNSAATTTRRLAAYRSAIIFRGTSNLTDIACFNVKSPEQYGSTVTSNIYGMYIETLAGPGIANTYGIYQSGTSDSNYFAGTFKLPNLGVYADNTAATSAGVPVGQLYRTSTGVVMVRY